MCDCHHFNEHIPDVLFSVFLLCINLLFSRRDGVNPHHGKVDTPPRARIMEEPLIHSPQRERHNCKPEPRHSKCENDRHDKESGCHVSCPPPCHLPKNKRQYQESPDIHSFSFIRTMRVRLSPPQAGDSLHPVVMQESLFVYFFNPNIPFVNFQNSLGQLRMLYFVSHSA